MQNTRSNIFVKNYGGSGESFHKEQAEILKKTIPFLQEKKEFVTFQV